MLTNDLIKIRNLTFFFLVLFYLKIVKLSIIIDKLNLVYTKAIIIRIIKQE